MKRILIACLLIAAPSVRAQDADPLKHLAPYLGRDAVIAGSVDVRNIDVAALLERLRKAGVSKAEADAAQAQFQKLKDRLVEAGVTRVYFTNIGNIAQAQMLFVAPTDTPAPAKDAFQVILSNSPALQARVIDKTVLVAAVKTFDALPYPLENVPAEWKAAFAKRGDLPSQIVILPPRTLLKALTETVPDLPPELGGGATAALVDSLRGAAIGADLSKKLAVEAAVQWKDEAAAKRAEAVIDGLIAMLKKSMRDVPEIPQLLADHRPTRVGDQLRLTLDAAAVDAVLLPLVGKARANASTAVSMNNLKQIAIAMHSYHDVHKSFPPQATVGKDKKPLLSWRVELLPYLEAQQLYKQFKLDEPWDSEHNKALIPKMPKVYLSPLSQLPQDAGKTTYVVPAGPKLVFDGPQKSEIRKILDGTANTILALDVDDAKAVIWTRPDDFPVVQKKPLAGHIRQGGILAAFCDGSVRRLSAKTSDEVLWMYFCPSDGQAIPEEKD